ncbi:MAG: hypothetical protein L0Y74_07580 [candidate division Zixibacteria bacterium]|nr:hypothetical protein [candidate division Zixibacteria bacterium]
MPSRKKLNSPPSNPNKTKKILKKLFNKKVTENTSAKSSERRQETISPEDRALLQKVKLRMPSTLDILEETVRILQSKASNLVNSDFIRSNFSTSLIEFEKVVFEIYLKHQKTMFLSLIDEWVAWYSKKLEEIATTLGPQGFAKRVCRDFYPLAQRLEFEAGQMRKSRGGHTFEEIVGFLLKRIGVPNEKPKDKNAIKLKNIDRVIPNPEVALQTPDKALFLSCKRTLRERWKQAASERNPTWRVFVITIDITLPESKADEANRLGMIVYVRDELKELKHLKKKTWVRKLTDFPKDLKEFGFPRNR